MNVDNTEEFRCISFCTGYAGIELGLRRVIPNLRTVAYVEVEAFACTNLVAKIEQSQLAAAPIWTDIKTFNGQPFRDRIHLITAGYPCQPFSTAGQRKGTSDPRHLWPYILEHIKTIRPIFVFCENVAGHLDLGFDEVYRSLANLGYKVEAGLFTAAGCGEGHIRERLYILANSNTKRLETHRDGRGRFEILEKRPPSSYNCTDAIKRFWNTASATVGRNDGIRNKLDRFRLLGNGVVPQTAELAFRTLMKLFEN